MKDKELDKYAQQLAKLTGKKHMDDSVNDILKQSMVERGFVVGNKEYNIMTLQNYCNLLATCGHLSIVDNNIGKTNARYTTENSLINGFLHLIMIAQTQFYVAEVEDPEWRKQISVLSEDDLLLYKLMC